MVTSDKVVRRMEQNMETSLKTSNFSYDTDTPPIFFYKNTESKKTFIKNDITRFRVASKSVIFVFISHNKCKLKLAVVNLIFPYKIVRTN